MSEKKSRKKRVAYTDDFKLEIVLLYRSGELTRAEILHNYNLAPSTFDRWVNLYKTYGSVSDKDIETEEAREIKELRKKIEEQEKVIYILKQATAILAKKGN